MPRDRARMKARAKPKRSDVRNQDSRLTAKRKSLYLC